LTVPGTTVAQGVGQCTYNCMHDAWQCCDSTTNCGGCGIPNTTTPAYVQGENGVLTYAVAWLLCFTAKCVLVLPPNADSTVLSPLLELRSMLRIEERTVLPSA
jgi:hypothetical protein